MSHRAYIYQRGNSLGGIKFRQGKIMRIPHKWNFTFDAPSSKTLPMSRTYIWDFSNSLNKNNYSIFAITDSVIFPVNEYTKLYF